MLIFNGNCAEAMDFYADVLGGTIKVKMIAGESPVAEHMPKEFADKVLNAQLALPGGGLLFACDCAPHIPYDVKGVHLALNLDTVEEAEEIFNRLSEGGEVEMPFAPTFWAEKFGMLDDKYGVSWMINGGLLIK